MIAKYEEYRRAVEGELRDVFEGRDGFLYNLLRYHLGWVDQQGQAEDGATPLHIQGAAALVCCEALSGEFEGPAGSGRGGAGTHSPWCTARCRPGEPKALTVRVSGGCGAQLKRSMRATDCTRWGGRR